MNAEKSTVKYADFLFLLIRELNKFKHPSFSKSAWKRAHLLLYRNHRSKKGSKEQYRKNKIGIKMCIFRKVKQKQPGTEHTEYLLLRAPIMASRHSFLLLARLLLATTFELQLTVIRWMHTGSSPDKMLREAIKAWFKRMALPKPIVVE